jgi:phage terminase small subunit
LTTNKTNVMVLKDENGKVRYVQALPQVAISNQERRQMRAFATEFGMTPNSFAALKLERPGLSPEDELERLISS